MRQLPATIVIGSLYEINPVNCYLDSTSEMGSLPIVARQVFLCLANVVCNVWILV